MLPGTTELILLIVIAFCIFGLGKIGDISRAIGELRARKAKGIPGEDAVDITPPRDGTAGPSGPKPGKTPQSVDEAVIDEPNSRNGDGSSVT